MLSSSKANQGIPSGNGLSICFTLVHFASHGHRVSSCQPRGRASQENWPEAWVYPGDSGWTGSLGDLGCTLSNWWEKSSASYLRPPVMKQKAARSGKFQSVRRKCLWLSLVLVKEVMRGTPRLWWVCRCRVRREWIFLLGPSRGGSLLQISPRSAGTPAREGGQATWSERPPGEWCILWFWCAVMCCDGLHITIFLKISSEQFSRKVAGKSVWFQLQISSRCNRQPALASAPRLAGPRFWYTSWGAEVSTNQPPTFPKRRCGATVILNICSGRARLWRDSCDLLRGHGSHEGSCQDVAGSHCPHCPWLKSTWAWHITVIPKCQQNPKNTNHRHHHHYPLVI